MSLYFQLSFLFVFATVIRVRTDFNKEVILTWTEKVNLDKFKERVTPFLPHDYMKEDIYLIRWLRAKDLDLESAEKMLKADLEWRRKQKMDTIDNEDWTDFFERYKYYDHSVAKDGQPVIWHPLGSWDIRRATISGEAGKLMRYLDRNIQFLCSKPRIMREKEAQNVTQVVYVLDLKGFTISQQGCVACLPVYMHFVLTYENHFPGCADKIMLINTPASFQPILRVVMPLLSKTTRDSLEIYGTNTNVWKPIMLKRVENNQLPPEIGGKDHRYDDL